MASWEETLLTAMKKEEQLICDLLKQAEYKVSVLKDNDVDALNAIVNREQPLLMQLQAQQKQRDALLAANGMQGKTLREAVEAAKHPALAGALQSLTGTARQLQTLNARSGAVVQSRLSQYSAVMRKMMPKKTIYTSQGRAPQVPSGRKLIDRKI